MPKTSPTTRSEQLLSQLGYVTDRCEMRVTSRIKRDLFGMFDLIAIAPGTTIGVQVTTSNNVAARVRKILDSEHAEDWLRACNRIHVHGWYRSKKTMSWVCNRTIIRFDPDINWSNEIIAEKLEPLSLQ